MTIYLARFNVFANVIRILYAIMVKRGNVAIPQTCYNFVYLLFICHDPLILTTTNLVFLQTNRPSQPISEAPFRVSKSVLTRKSKDLDFESSLLDTIGCFFYFMR